MVRMPGVPARATRKGFGLQVAWLERRVVALAAVVAAMVSIQSGASLAKQLFPMVGAAGTTALRLGFATIVLCALFRPWRSWPRGSVWQAVALYGVALGGMNLLFYQALDRIPLGVAVALEFVGPLAIALATSRRREDYLWALVAILGLGLLLPINGLSSLDPVGAAFALGAGGCWALYIVFGKRLGTSLPGGLAATLGMACALAVTFPFGWAHAGPALFAPALLPLGLAIGILSSALPYSLEMVALRALPTQTFGILMSLEPAIAALSGLLFLGELLSPVQLVAIGLVMAASIGSTAAAAPAVAPES